MAKISQEISRHRMQMMNGFVNGLNQKSSGGLGGEHVAPSSFLGHEEPAQPPHQEEKPDAKKEEKIVEK